MRSRRHIPGLSRKRKARGITYVEAKRGNIRDERPKPPANPNWPWIGLKVRCYIEAKWREVECDYKMGADHWCVKQLDEFGNFTGTRMNVERSQLVEAEDPDQKLNDIFDEVFRDEQQ